jgi:hypothetical protein
MNDICATWPIGGDIGSVGFHEMGRKALAARDDLVGRGAQGTAADHHAARRISAAAERDIVSVGLRQMDLVLGHAELIRDYGLRTHASRHEQGRSFARPRARLF